MGRRRRSVRITTGRPHSAMTLCTGPQRLILRRGRGREVARHLGPLHRREAGEGEARARSASPADPASRACRAGTAAQRHDAQRYINTSDSLSCQATSGAAHCGQASGLPCASAGCARAGVMRAYACGARDDESSSGRHLAPHRRQGRSLPSSMPSFGQRSVAVHRSPTPASAPEHRHRGTRIGGHAPVSRCAGGLPAPPRGRRAARGGRGR